MPAALESSHELAGDERAAQSDKSNLWLFREKNQILVSKDLQGWHALLQSKAEERKEKRENIFGWSLVGMPVYTLDAYRHDHNPGWLTTKPGVCE